MEGGCSVMHFGGKGTAGVEVELSILGIVTRTLHSASPPAMHNPDN